MKQLEKSAEKAVEREEKLKEKILSIQQKFKSAEGRCESYMQKTCDVAEKATLAKKKCVNRE